MFNRMGLSNRLIFIVISINLVVLILVAIIANSSSDAALRNQAIQRFTSKNGEATTAINQILQIHFAAVQAIIASLDDVVDLNDSAALRQHFTEFTTTSHDDDLISRIGIFRPDGSTGVLYIPEPLDAETYQWRVYRQASERPSNQYIPEVLRGSGGVTQRWFQQSPAMYDSTGEGAVTFASRFEHAQGMGVIWFDISKTRLAQLLLDTTNTEGLLSESITGYAMLIDSDQLAIATLDVPNENSMNVNRTTRTLLNRRDDVTRGSDGLYRFADPFNADAIGLFSFNRITVNNWLFVTVLPEAEIPELPSNIYVPIGIVAIIGIVTLTFAVNRFIAGSIVKPLVDLGRSASEIGDGNLRFVIFHRDKQDEVGVLANAMDQMKNRLRESYDELQSWGRTLEQRVEDRTLQLATAQQRAEVNAMQLRAVYDESLSVVNETQLGPVLDTFIGRILNLLNATYCAVWLLDKDRDRIRLVSTNDERRRKNNAAVVIHRTDGIVGQTIQSDTPIVVDDYKNYTYRIHLEEYYEDMQLPFNRAVSVPLKFAGHAIGAVVVGRPEGAPPFDSNDERQLTLFTNIVAPSVRNMQLFVQFQEAVAAAERANEVKTHFLASVTHELRTPLNLIINNMDFMRAGMFGDVNDDQVSRLNQTVRSAEHLLYLINDLLDVSKMEAGEMQMFIQRSDVYTMLEDAVDNAYALLETYEGKEEVQLRVEIEDGMPEVPMDTRRIRQVLNNLLSNAIKFTQKGTVTLTVFQEERGIHFSVHDTGMGIPKEEMGLLFAAFERTTAAKQSGIEGTGLGLPISRYLVQQHGSDLTVVSEVGAGSTFAFLLPFKTPETIKGLSMSDTQQINAILLSRNEE